MLAGIFWVLAEYERSIISERTKAGLRAAKARGKQVGNRKRYFDEEKAAELRARGWGADPDCQGTRRWRRPCPRMGEAEGEGG
jgi:hypothetical protein